MKATPLSQEFIETIERIQRELLSGLGIPSDFLTCDLPSSYALEARERREGFKRVVIGWGSSR